MNQKTENSVEKEILQIANDTFTAIKDKDRKKLDDILAEDFVYRNPIEGEQSKAEFLAVIGSLPMKLTSVWSDDMKVNIYADVAVMTGTQQAKIQLEGCSGIILKCSCSVTIHFSNQLLVCSVANTSRVQTRRVQQIVLKGRRRQNIPTTRSTHDDY